MALRRCCRSVGGIPRVLFSVRPEAVSCVPKQALSSLTTISRCAYALTTTTKSKFLLLRNLSSSPTINPDDVTYEQLKQLLAGQAAVVIDVREPWELREYGSIPGSINVPLGQVNVALQLDPEDFKEKYGGDMPHQADNVVFSCLAGIRSKKALDTAASLGYRDVQHYAGGWQDWAKNEQLN